MLRNRYYVQEPILSVHTPPGGPQQCLYVPAGEVVYLERSDPANHAFVEITWDSKVVKIFQQDLYDRAQLVHGYSN